MSESLSISRRQFLQGSIAFSAILPFATVLPGYDSKTVSSIGDNQIALSTGEEILQKLWDENFLTETTEIVSIPTFRDPNYWTEAEVVSNLEQIQQLLQDWATDFNTQELTQLQLEPFEWKKTINSKEYWLFGFRIGASNPTHKVAMICHLDTVPPGEETEEWKPFDPYIKPDVEYLGGVQDFLVGRGTIDDKGPAISAFIAARALAKEYDGTDKLDDLAVEIFFDTSEETDVATSYYLDDPETQNPNFGVVYDGQWTIRAEKGADRPVFLVNYSAVPAGSLWIEDLQTTPSSATNQIPDWAQADIKGDAQVLQDFYNQVEARYSSHEFDDPDYTPAVLEVSMNAAGDTVTLTTLVAGAQHGSAPDENREGGANPLVSLANFLADLVSEGTLEANAIGSMVEFIKWTWGTRVFGENHEVLVASDEVFKIGTTYALTKCTTTEGTPQLHVDIRYAMAHNSEPWDGVTEGLLPGQSLFPDIFNDLISQFNTENESYLPVKLNDENAFVPFSPDLRLPSNKDFQNISAAYETVMGEPSPEFAVGGGTDAKGYTYLLAAGPLFSDRVGPPINYHGIGEGAPLRDLENSTRIIYNVMVNEVEAEYSGSISRNDNLKVKKGRRPETFKGHRFNF